MREDPSVPTTRWLRPVATGLGLVLLAAAAGPADAIPAFARKYRTSCQTCHTAYPKLNPFGTAFRLRGYRMPGETEEMIKEPPVALGAEGYKRVWPRAVWPSDIPGTVPLSVDTRLADVTQHDEETGDTNSNDFRFPESIELLSAGTVGDTASFFGALEFEVDSEHGEEIETAIGHAEFHFNGLWNTGSGFNVKIGRFSPEATQTFNHGYVLTDMGPATMFGFNPIGFHGSNEVGAGGHHGGGGGIALPAGVDGVEIYGILNHRFTYSVGVGNGITGGEGTRDGNEAKDVFGRVAYKWGGLPLDGEGYQAGPKPWAEKSLQIGVFGYSGDGEGVLFEGTGHHAGSFAEDREFDRVGFDVNAYVGNVNFIAGYVSGEDTLAVFETPADEHGEGGEDEHGEGGGDEHGDEHGEPGGLELASVGDFEYDAWFAEADVVFLPWLQGAVRYEILDPSRESSEDFERITLNGTFLIRANVKGILEYQKDLGGANEDDYTLRGILRFAF